MDIPVKRVPDPVFLMQMSEYLPLIEKTEEISDKQFLFLYLLSSQLDAIEFAIELVHEKELTIGYDLHTDWNMEMVERLGTKAVPLVDVGPKEFLGLVCAAQVVVTNFFHRTAFSLIFHKQFYTFPVISPAKPEC